MDAAVEPRPRRRSRPRLRRARAHRCRSAVRSASSSAPPVWPPTPPELEGAAAVATVKGSDLVGRQLPAAVRLLREHARVPSACSAATSSPPTRAPASCTWPPGSARTTSGPARRPASRSSARRRARPLHRRGARLRRTAGLRGQPAASSTACADEGALLRVEEYTHSYPHCWRTDTPLIYKAVSSWFVRVTAIKDDMVELNQQIAWTPPTRRRRGVRQVAGGGAGLEHQPQPFLGDADPGVEERRPRLSPHRRLRQPRRARAGLRRHAPTTCTGRRSTSSRAPNPDDPTGRSTMRRIPDVLDCWFESGSMPFAQLHYPFENRAAVRGALPRRLHRRVRRPDPGLVLHPARAGRRRCSTGRRSGPASPTASCSATTAASSPSGSATSPTPRRSSPTSRRRRHALVPALLARCCGARTASSSAKALAEPVRLVLNPIWNTWYFLTLYSNADGMRGRFRTDQRRRPRPLRARQSSPARRASDWRRWTANDLAGATAAISSFLDALTNWYVRRSRDRFWRSSVDVDGPAATATRRPPTRATRLRRPWPTSRTPTTPCTPSSTSSAAWRRPSCPSSARRSTGASRAQRSVHLHAVAGARRAPGRRRARRSHGPRP